ncbi:reverse transcriptase domain-containing protein [Tanacetum coccineum]
MSNHEQPTPSHPRSDVRNTIGKDKQTPQGSARTTSAVDLEEFCEKHYERLLPIMADKYEYEKRKKEKLEEVKARLDFGDNRKKSTRAQESAYSVSGQYRHERQRTLSKERRGSTVFKRLGGRGWSASMHFDSRQESSRYTENYSESEDSESGHWKSKSRRKKFSVEDDDLSQPWVFAETDLFTSRISRPQIKKGGKKVLRPGGSGERDIIGRRISIKARGGFRQPKPLRRRKEDQTVRQKITQSFSLGLEISFPPLGNEEGAKGPLIIEAEVGGHQVHRMCIDGGSSFEILYEHYFNRLCLEIRNQMVPATTSLVGFSGEIKWPLGQITLLVKVGDDKHSTSAWMDFMVVRSTSLFNGIIGRPGLRKMKAVPSTTHGMIKLPVIGGILTLRSSKIIPIECAMVSRPEEQPLPINKVKEERIKVAINPEHP